MRISFFIIILSTFFLSSIDAQPLNKSTYASMLRTADLAYSTNDYYNALEWYKSAYEEEKTLETTYRIAQCLYKLRDYAKAEKRFARVLKKDKDGMYPDVVFYHAKMQKMNGKYADAVAGLQSFIATTQNDTLKNLARNELTGAEMALESVETLGLTIDRAKGKINTKQGEYSPTFFRDDKTVYFASLNENKVIEAEELNDDQYLRIYKSTRGDDEWSKPTALDEKINREAFHTGNPAISEDGTTMYFTRGQLTGNFVTESRIYFSAMGADEFGPAEEVIGINGEYVNKHPVFGEHFGKEVIFFVSDMPGGIGGFDVYYATRKGDGVFADPVNLGETINTAGDDVTPFYKDGVLYFSSNGHPGFGGYDIFHSTWNGTSWSAPKNMGQGYNSGVDDVFFRLDNSGYKGFVVSNRTGTKSVQGKTCCNDLFEFSIKKTEASLLVGTLEGKKTKVTGSTIQLIEMTKNKMGKTNKKNTGESYKTAFELELDKAYMLIGSKEGYYPDTLEFNTQGLSDSKRFKKILKLKPIPKPKEPAFETYTINQSIELKNIFYDYDDDKILAEAEPDLQIVLDLMNQYPEMKIELSSHTDARGKEGYNQKLSQRRASSAKRWLVKAGISASRIKAVGKGEKEIRNRCVNGMDKECSDDEHRFNRRTEVRITEGPTTFTIEKKRLRKKG